MDTHTVLRRAARLEQVVLAPSLHLVDERVVRQYLPADSVVRRSFERALGALDDAVDQLLREPATATDTTTDTGTDTDTAHDAEAEAAGVDDVEELTEVLLAQEETETFAGELAEDDELRQVQAELQAKRIIEEQRDEP
ncbi:hypothetical protein [Jatrophihabitans endophyticus]|uniref:hypothetical protein n=1 Tax=Jatrophihabitans endophyticus TaxID=1206085 RepID=UPI0019E62CAB|nr:hypothetical protein [Jatrophihabitans endophyticus]MBE7187716.1 hypothetical protein [Jatrophihabitans endophyticus]